MHFLTTTLSYLSSSAPQADSWCRTQVEPDNVIIVDIGDQALDIFLHGPESAHKNDIVKTFTHTSNPIQPCTLLKQTNKQENSQLTKHDAFAELSSSCPRW